MQIDTIPLLDHETAQAFANQVKRREDLWIPRGGFYTIGASAYLDAPELYPILCQYTNPVLDHLWNNLQYEVMDNLPKRFAPKTTRRVNRTAIMGAHIFTPITNGVKGHIHTDAPYERINWGGEITNPFSFTLALEMPAVGGGMDWFTTCQQSSLLDEQGVARSERTKHVRYEAGTLYVHDGLTPPRIANCGDMVAGEHRITLQGHGVTLSDGVTAIYF